MEFHTTASWTQPEGATQGADRGNLIGAGSYKEAHGPLSREDDDNHHPEMTVERVDMGDNDEE